MTGGRKCSSYEVAALLRFTCFFFQDATGENKEGTPSLTPSPERTKKKKGEDSESDTEEYKRMKERKKIQNLEVMKRF